MPELPEVETYARDLARVLPGRTLTGARVDWPRQLPRNTPEDLAAGVAGQRIQAVARRGKYLVLRLADRWLLIHLKMSGRMQVAVPDALPDRHAHVVFGLDGGGELRFHDPRKFGRVYLLEDPAAVLGRLGPEPLGDDAAENGSIEGAMTSEGLSAELRGPRLTRTAFRARWAGRRGALKPLLLDQTFLAGLGNIYVDESLWAARLHPLRPADSLAPDEVDRLFDAIRDVLARGVAARGTSLSAAGYRDLTGNMGEMQGTLAVFRRTGEPCPACGTPVVRIVVGQRSTHLCPNCQPAGMRSRLGDESLRRGTGS